MLRCPQLVVACKDGSGAELRQAVMGARLLLIIIFLFLFDVMNVLHVAMSTYALQYAALALPARWLSPVKRTAVAER